MKRLCLIFLVLVALAVFATTVKPVSVEHLAAESTHVVLARAIDSRSSWNASHTRIYTFTRFQPLNSIKGSLAQTFTVKALGGHADGYTMKVAGVRGWQPGDTSVLFLRPEPDGTFVVTGLMQGDFRVVGQSAGTVFVSNGISGVKQMNASGEISGYQGTRMTLGELEQRVKKAGSQ